MSYYAKRFFGQQGIVTDGLKLWLDASNPLSYPGTGTTWYDLSGNGNNGTMINGVTYNAANGGVMRFDGVDDYTEIPSLPLISPQITPISFEVWFINYKNTGADGLIGRSEWRTSGCSMGIQDLNRLKFTCSTQDQSFEAIFPYNNSVMSQGVFIFDGRDIVTYRNGVLVSTYTAPFDLTGRTLPIRIGHNGQGGWSFTQVDVPIVRIYHKRLSVTEIMQNFNTAKAKFNI